MKDQDTEKFKTLMKEIEDTNKWKRILYSGTWRTNSVKMSILLKEF